MGQQKSRSGAGPLEEQLRWDLANARRFELTAETLRLSGCAARDFATQVVTHRRSEVFYRVTMTAEKTWLLREEIQPEMSRPTATAAVRSLAVA